MEKYLNGEEIDIVALKTALRTATCANQIVPVLLVPLRNKGVQPLLDAVVDFLPSHP